MKKLLYTFLFILLTAHTAFGAGPYYVDCGQTDGAEDGSFAHQWNSVADVNDASIEAGGDVYFKQGSTCSLTENLNFNWQGVSAGNLATIGCFEGVGDFDCSGARPILDGVGMAHTDYTATIKKSGMAGALYVNIEYLNIYRAGMMGIYIEGTAAISEITINNNIIDSSWKSSMMVILDNSGSDLDVTNNVIKRNGQVNNQTTPPAIVLPNFGTVIIMGSGNATTTVPATNIVFSGNQVYYNVSKETISIWGGTDGAIVEKNVIYDNPLTNVTIYPNGSENQIIRYNLIYGTTYLDNKGGRRDGIGINNEAQRQTCDTGGAEIYGNLIANMEKAIYLGISEEDCHAVDNLIYNNTFVDNTHSIYIWAAGATGSGNEIKNNISWTASRGSHVYNCSASGYTWDTNLWNGGTLPTGAETCEKNEVNGSPLLAKGSSGWQSLSAETGGNFALLPGSAAIDAGVDLVSYDNMINPNTVNFTATPINVDLIDGSVYGVAHDIGAIVYSLQVYGVEPSDGSTGISITAEATWNYVSSVDDASIWLNSGTCSSITPCDGTADSVDDADKTYNMTSIIAGALNSNFCLQIIANDGAETGECQEFDFTTTSGPPNISSRPPGLEVKQYGGF